MKCWNTKLFLNFKWTNFVEFCKLNMSASYLQAQNNYILPNEPRWAYIFKHLKFCLQTHGLGYESMLYLLRFFFQSGPSDKMFCPQFLWILNYCTKMHIISQTFYFKISELQKTEHPMDLQCHIVMSHNFKIKPIFFFIFWN